MHRTEIAGDGRQTLHGIVGIAHYPTRQEQALDIIATIELHRNLFKFADRERGTLDIVRTAVDAVRTVVHAIIGQHDLQQRDASPVIGKGVADAYPTDSRTHHALLTLAHSAARRTRHIVFRRLCEDSQFLHGLFSQHGAKRFDFYWRFFRPKRTSRFLRRKSRRSAA